MNGWTDSREQEPKDADYPILIHCPNDTGFTSIEGVTHRGIFRRERGQTGFASYVYWRSATIVHPKELFETGRLEVEAEDEIVAIQHERQEMARLVSGLYDGNGSNRDWAANRDRHVACLTALKTRLKDYLA